MGGQDLFQCEAENMPMVSGDLRYEDIVENSRIDFVETLSEGDRHMSSAL